ncbi:MAG: hypothetical protein U9Q69_03165 [Nanoarchaeota archaeon]|nr:hypothetical protein [Nanoarchaeota archaeon]
MQKRGQVTLFIVLGIVIITVIIIGLYFSGIISESEEKARLAERNALTQKEKNIADRIESCLLQTTKKAVLAISKNGGYYPPKENSISYLGVNAPLYFDDGKEEVPNEETFSKSLANYIDENLIYCAQEIEEIEILDNPETEVKFNNGILVKMDFPIKLKEIKLSHFMTLTDISYDKTFAKPLEFYELVRQYDLENEAVEMGRLLQDTKFKYGIADYENSTLYYLIKDNYINKKPLIFAFAVRKKIVGEYLAALAPIDEIMDFLIDAEDSEVEENEEITPEQVEELVNDSQYNINQAEEFGGLLYEI